MRIAAIYDIHANLPALEAVLDEVRRCGVHEVVVGGDVLPGPMPVETIQCLRELEIPARYIVGNGDREVLAQMRGVETDWYRGAREPWREPVRWNAEQLGPEYEEWIAAWPQTLRRSTAVGDVLFCHATPRNDTDIFTRLTPEEVLMPLFAETHAALVVCGHTHMQFDRRIGGIRVVNAGSVGMPFGAAGADWLLLGDEIELRHTTYDLEIAAQRIRRTNYPQAEDFAAHNVLQPPSETAMIEAFTPAQLK